MRHRHAHQHSDRVMRGAAAERYDRFVARWVLARLYRAVAADVAAVTPPGGEVLDVGTGPGRLLVELAGRRPDIGAAGVDPSEDMVRLARARLADTAHGRADVREAGAESLPFPDGSFDVVVSTLSAHHWADPAAAVAEQARVLRPGGQLRVYDLRSHSVDGLAEHARAAALQPACTTEGRLGWVARRLVGTLVAVKPNER
ncbi:MAG: class I SAM-dependent methyltransferase [Dermatophilaceae bacterium]